MRVPTRRVDDTRRLGGGAGDWRPGTRCEARRSNGGTVRPAKADEGSRGR